MKKILVIFMTLGFISSAQAGFRGNIGIDMAFSGDDGAGNDFDNMPLWADIELGWSTLGLSYGLNYETTLTDIEFENSTGEFSHNGYGIFVGYEFPVMFRIYGAYMLGGAIEGEGTFERTKMSGTKLGLAYTGFPLIDITLEIRSYEFDEDQNGNDVDSELNATTLGLAFSF